MSAQDAVGEQLTFAVPLFAVHCFFHCGHSVREADPVTAHDAMEVHYASRHQAAISRIVSSF